MNLTALSNTFLFRGASEEDLHNMLNCLDAYSQTFEKGEVIFRSGQTIDHIGFVISGAVAIRNVDVWGNPSILGFIESGHIFADNYAFIAGEPILNDVLAAKQSEILFLNASKLLKVCPKACTCHNALIKNLFTTVAKRNLMLTRRLTYTAPKSIRGKVLTYLSDKAKQSYSNSVTVPFNRQQLADYLNVDRSAMCNELSKMQQEGIITYNKSTFKIKTDN